MEATVNTGREEEKKEGISNLYLNAGDQDDQGAAHETTQLLFCNQHHPECRIPVNRQRKR